ncbi:MAG: hypothetical protein NZ893_03465, partial [Candidatus Aenigmarchaeota archaeon]|nr:hypothetical protein [Candidatus Aenigmarchaeota archaeon]
QMGGEQQLTTPPTQTTPLPTTILTTTPPTQTTTRPPTTTTPTTTTTPLPTTILTTTPPTQTTPHPTTILTTTPPTQTTTRPPTTTTSIPSFEFSQLEITDQFNRSTNSFNAGESFSIRLGIKNLNQQQRQILFLSLIKDTNGRLVSPIKWVKETINANEEKIFVLNHTTPS